MQVEVERALVGVVVCDVQRGRLRSAARRGELHGEAGIASRRDRRGGIGRDGEHPRIGAIHGDSQAGEIFVADVLLETFNDWSAADATVGKIGLGGSWIASSLAVGIVDITSDGFGRNDATISGDTTPDIFPRIAKIVIHGGAMGTSGPTPDHFGITAQQIGKLKVGGARIPLDASIEGVSLDNANGDFRAVQFA